MNAEQMNDTKATLTVNKDDLPTFKRIQSLIQAPGINGAGFKMLLWEFMRVVTMESRINKKIADLEDYFHKTITDVEHDLRGMLCELEEKFRNSSAHND
ncbi:MAG: hypothetical protein HQL77_19110 [Magnetococcales bacterium]|nr:hypothetical protein [Magnetococcales bacterium]